MRLNVGLCCIYLFSVGANLFSCDVEWPCMTLFVHLAGVSPEVTLAQLTAVRVFIDK